MIDFGGSPLKKSAWRVETIPLVDAQKCVALWHYSKGGSNTAVYRHGLVNCGSGCLYGAAWWIPPTKSAAIATHPDNWTGVLALSRLAVAPQAPKNSASFLLASSMRLIDRDRWPCLVTYADEWRGHTGAIYRATNWTYVGRTKPEAVYTLDGRMVARKAGPKTRTKAEMLGMGCVLEGRYAKHKFVSLPR